MKRTLIVLSLAVFGLCSGAFAHGQQPIGDFHGQQPIGDFHGQQPIGD